MIERARRSFPGLAVSLLLAAPGLAGASEAVPSAAPSLRTSGVTQSASLRDPAAKASNRAAAVQAPRKQAIRPRARATRLASVAPIWTDRFGAWQQVGTASWYGGPRWQGKPTASGVRYDENQLTAAHASLPIGSRVKVTVADTGRTVIVTINDRPGTRTRIIDLSRAAASELGILQRGVARVSLTPG